MPYTTQEVPAFMFTRHNGVGVYHTYKNDDIDNSPARTYWFVTDPYLGEQEAFDVRELPAWKETIANEGRRPFTTETDLVTLTLRKSIESGILTADGVQVTA